MRILRVEMQNSLNDALVKLKLTQNDSQTNPFIEKLEKEFGPLILHCQETSELYDPGD